MDYLDKEQRVFTKAEPYVGEDGIYVPLQEYVYEGVETSYTCIITKQMFQEAYNKYIKSESRNLF